MAGGWEKDGPELPVEFVRQSTRGHLTLVIDPESPPQRVLWAPLTVTTVPEAIEHLWAREGTETDRPIGRWPNPRAPHLCADVIEQWVKERDLGGVVWTALGPKFLKQTGRRPSQAEAIEYLENLPKGTRCLAEQYVRCAPLQIDTPYRRAIIDQFGWRPLGR